MELVEIEGASEEEATKMALKELGLQDKADLEIVEMKEIRKFMGMGGKTYKIKARKKSAESKSEEQTDKIAEPVSYVVNEVEEAEIDVIALAKEKESDSSDSADDEQLHDLPDGIVTMESLYRPWVEEGPSGIVIPSRGKGFGNRVYSPVPLANDVAKNKPPVKTRNDRPSAPRPSAPRPSAPQETEEVAEAVYEDAENSVITDQERESVITFVSDTIKTMGIEAKAEGFKLEDRLVIKIDSDSGGLLIGRRGETIDSLQYLADIVVNRGREERIRVVLDTENYREKRKFKTVNMAKNIADDVASSRKSISLSPMSPGERRIVHMTLAEDKRVKTVSEGMGTRRRVVVKPFGGGKSGGGRGKPKGNGYNKGGRGRR